MWNLYQICLLLINPSIFAFIIAVAITTYKKTNYLPHKMLIFSFLLLFMAYFGLFIITFIPSTQRDVAEFVLSLINTFLMLGLLSMFFTFTYVRYNHFHPITNLASFDIGIVLSLLWIQKGNILVYDELLRTWVGHYNPFLGIFAFPMIILVLYAFIIPLLKKMKAIHEDNVQTQLFLQLLGISLMILWGFLGSFSSIRIIQVTRVFLLPLGWLFWSISLKLDPFNIIVSNASLTHIVLTTESGLPILVYNVKTNQNEHYEIVSSLLMGIRTALEEVHHQILKKQTQLVENRYQDKVITLIKVNFLTAYLIGDRVDEIIKMVIQTVLNELLQEKEFFENIKDGSLNLSTSLINNITLKLSKAVKRVLVP